MLAQFWQLKQYRFQVSVVEVRHDLQVQFQLAQCSQLRGVQEQLGPTRRCSRSATHSAELEALGTELMNSSDPHELLALVTDERSFLAFTQALAHDRAASGAAESKQPSSPFAPENGGWENTTIEAFLEAAAAWAESTNFGESQGLARDNLWRKFAAFLYCGKIYE